MSKVSSEQFDITGIRVQPGACVVLVGTEWNADVVDELENGARKVLDQFPVTVISFRVPGAVELGFGVKKFWDLHKDGVSRPSAFIVLGCVIRGGTPHFDYVCQAVTASVVQLNMQLPVPTIFGVLTVDNHLQAVERLGGGQGHKGQEAATTALKMITLEDSFNI